MLNCCPCHCVEQGGIRVGGKSSVLVNKVGDGHSAILPLQEIGVGIVDEFKDITDQELHGTGGNGRSEFCTLRDKGLGCQFSQLGSDGTQFIQMQEWDFPLDQEFAVSCWIRLDGQFSQNPIFSRGDSVQITTSFLNHIAATIMFADIVITAYSPIVEIGPKKWYHLAVSWKPYRSIQIFLDGNLVGETETPYGVILEPIGPTQIGRVGEGRGITGNIQDVRLHPEARSAAWWKAEWQNYCEPFYYLQ